ncbi:MAG: hypothetical protein NWR72_17065 [Bacteroidia bacterium]|nr:hypothetical protein [Bacteroidia bacterium]
MRHLSTISSLFALIFLLSACGSGDNSMNEAGYFSGDVSLEEVTDPKEGAFSVRLPEGWHSMVSMERPYGVTRSVGFSTSPDGKASIFFGDTKMPVFYLPNPQYGMTVGMNMGSPLISVKRFVPAEYFFDDYVKRQFGSLPEFRITGNEPNPFHQQLLQKQANELGMNPQITTASVTFEFMDQGERVKARLNGSTFLIDQIWMAELHGYLTTGDAASMDEVLKEVSATFKSNPEWQQRENERIQEQTRQSTAAHNQRMQAQQRNFDAHQQMMKERYAANDAQHQNWMNNQAAQDRQHERFIDAIRGEETVTNGAQTGKVESGYNQYYVNPNTGEYVGTNTFENPNASVYELWQMRK